MSAPRRTPIGNRSIVTPPATLRLAKEGAILEILDLKDASAAVEEIRALGGEGHSTICDCADEEQIAAGVKEIEARQGHIGILVKQRRHPDRTQALVHAPARLT